MKETTKKIHASNKKRTEKTRTKKEPGREAGSKNKITLITLFFLSGCIDKPW